MRERVNATSLKNAKSGSAIPFFWERLPTSTIWD